MNGPGVEGIQGIAARERTIAGPSAGLEGHLRLTQVNVAEVRAAVRKRRRNVKPEFILHAEKWR